MSEFGITGDLIVKYDGESFYPGKLSEEYIKSIPPTPTYMIKDAESVVIQWGSTQGAVEEAVCPH